MSVLAGLIGFVVVIAAGAAAFSRQQAKAKAAEAARQEDRAAQAEAVNRAHVATIEALDQLKPKHAQERADADERLKAGRRDHFDNTW